MIHLTAHAARDLARFLAGQVRPRTIPTDQWQEIKVGRAQSVTWAVFGELCDHFPSDLLAFIDRHKADLELEAPDYFAYRLGLASGLPYEDPRD